MIKHKRLIVKWLHDFVSVMCDLSDADFRLAVESGFGRINVPTDIFDVFRRRGIIEHSVEKFHYIVLNHSGGETLVTVAPDPMLKTGLVLSIDTNGSNRTN